MGEEEAAVRREFDSRREKLKDDELLETTSLRIKHATEVERLQHRICTAALGVRGEEQASGSSRGCSKKRTQFQIVCINSISSSFASPSSRASSTVHVCQLACTCARVRAYV